MIEQQINLYQERFRERRLWVSAQQVVALLLATVIGIALWSYMLTAELAQADQRSRLNLAAKEQLAAELESINAELAGLLEDNSVALDIENASRQIAARKKVLNFVDANRFGSGEGFSGYLLALSNLQVKNIWLSQILLAENFVQIKGSSLNAEQVPGYFDRFSEESVFHGNRFDLFEVSRNPDSDWKVDFEIATSGSLDD